jgi:hypothetical protein
MTKNRKVYFREALEDDFLAAIRRSRNQALTRPLIATLGFKMGILREKPQDLKGEPTF